MSLNLVLNFLIVSILPPQLDIYFVFNGHTFCCCLKRKLFKVTTQKLFFVLKTHVLNFFNSELSKNDKMYHYF